MNTSKLNYKLPASFKDNNEKEMAFEQYRILVDSLNTIHSVRENSNFFWIPVNIGVVSATAYIRDMDTLADSYKHFLFWTIIAIGFTLCISWLGYLASIKKAVESRCLLIIELEKYFPIPLFTNILSYQNDSTKSKLTITQMLVPYLFLGGYIFFTLLLIFFTPEVVHVNPQ